MNVPARNDPNKTDVPAYPDILTKADKTNTMRMMLDMWSKRAKWYSMYRRKKGAKQYLVRMGVATAMATEATIGRPISQPRLTSSDFESSPRRPITLFNV